MGNYAFPDPNIDPKKKDFKWILQYVNAAWNEGNGGMPYGTFYTAQRRYLEIKQYALGKQSVNKFKKNNPSDKPQDKTSQTLDWTNSSLIAGIRERSISKILQRAYNIEAFATDPMSKSEQDDAFNELLVKIHMRDALQGSPLANSPMLQPKNGEPQDLEQLQMAAEFGFKNEFAMTAEQIVDFVFSYNNFNRERKKSTQESYDIGVAGYKLWNDENGMVRFRAVMPEGLITSYCEQPDYSDADYIGEAIEVSVADIVPYFSPQQIKDICDKNKGKYGNPKMLNTTANYYTPFKVLVFDLQFITYDMFAYKGRIDKYGNEVFGKSEFNDIEKERNMVIDSVSEPKYLKNTRKVKYQAKWIVGTDYMYDYGVAPNQNRKLSSWWDTSLDYILHSWNFHKMQFTGITERLIPLEDDYYETRMKLQNIKRKLIPYLINLDVRALESVNFGSGGDKWDAMKIVDFLFQSHVLVYSGENLLDGNKNQSKGASIEATGMIADLLSLRQELDRIKAEAIDISGLNTITMGNPNAKNLNSTNQAGVQATNDALYLIMLADSELTKRLADMIVQKAQCAISYGKTANYTQALGTDSVKVLEITKEMPLREFGITIQDAPSAEERQEMLQELSISESQGLIEPGDRYLIQTTKNLKQAWQILSYRIAKRKEAQQQFELQKIQTTTDQQKQSAMITAQAQQQAIQLQGNLDLQKINAEGQWNYITTKMKVEGQTNDNELIQQAKIIAAHIAAESKKENLGMKSKA